MTGEDTTTTSNVARTNINSPNHENLVNVSNGIDHAVSLADIHKNMGKMASLLAKFCEQPDTDKQQAKTENPHLTSWMFQTLTLKKTLTHQANKGIYKIGDELEDRDDIKMLTKHSKTTGQKEQETAAKETKYLQDFANSFEDHNSTSDKVEKELADIAQKRWGQKQGKSGTTVRKYFIFHWKDCAMYIFFINRYFALFFQVR